MIRDFYFKKCNSNQDRIVKMYKYVYNRDKEKQMKFGYYKKTLHYQRRIVSQFYQQLANLRYNYKNYINYNEFKKTINVTFTSKDLEIIQILYIIDKNALTQIDDENNKISKNKINDFIKKHESLENMIKFYQEFL